MEMETATWDRGEGVPCGRVPWALLDVPAVAPDAVESTEHRAPSSGREGAAQRDAT